MRFAYYFFVFIYFIVIKTCRTIPHPHGGARIADNRPPGQDNNLEGSKNRWLMRLARDFRLLAI